MPDVDPPPRVQRVGDMPAEEARGQAERASGAPAERLGVAVVEPDGRRIGEITNAATILEEQFPHVVVGLDEAVREALHLETDAVDIEARYLAKRDQRTIQLTEPLRVVLRQEGFNV